MSQRLLDKGASIPRQYQNISKSLLIVPENLVSLGSTDPLPMSEDPGWSSSGGGGALGAEETEPGSCPFQWPSRRGSGQTLLPAPAGRPRLRGRGL